MNIQHGGPQLVKQLHLENEGRNKLINGIDKLAAAVGSTLGASGRTVVLEDDFGNPNVTKDGVTVANSIVLQDPVENLGVRMMREAARKTADNAGDGTTTSTILCQAIIKSFIESDSKESFRHLRNGVESYLQKLITELDSRAIKLNNDRLKQVSVISANNDEELGSIIADAFIAAGDQGIVTMETSQTSETYIDTVEGTHITQTVANQHFFTDSDREISELENPLVFLSTTAIPNTTKIRDILEYAIKNNRSILFVAPLEQQPLAALAMNKIKGNIKVSVVEPPSFGLKRKDLLDDLALLVGAKVFDDSLGDSLDAITVDMLGSADKVVSDRSGTTFVVDDKPEVAENKIAELKELLDEATHPMMIKHLEKRLSLLNGGVSRVFVGADTEVELKEKIDRVDDAIHAVRSAKKEGILPGGGAALFFLAENLEAENDGEEIMRESIYAPMIKIVSNANMTEVVYPKPSWGIGIDAIDGTWKDMLEAGIVDPTLVTKQALINAVSVAMTILSTDVVISNMREE